MIASRFELAVINQAHARVLTDCGYRITELDLVTRFCGMSDPEMLAIIEREWGRALSSGSTTSKPSVERVWINFGLR
jgi:hypothetical protein